MSSKIFVGNLPFSVNGEKLSEEFKKFGQVTGANVVIDKTTKRSKGFGFVEFISEEAARAAIEEMNEKEMNGRKLTVTLANKQ